MLFLVPYAYDRMPGGQPRTGVPAKRLGSKARCDAVVKFCRTELKIGKYEQCQTVLTAGFNKENKEGPDDHTELCIADQMAKYLSHEHNFCSLISSRKAWGTFEETKEAIREVLGFFPDLRKTRVYVSTNLGHMPRVWLCWFFLKPKGWKVHFVTAKHSFTPKEYFQETAKFFQYLYRFLFRRW